MVDYSKLDDYSDTETDETPDNIFGDSEGTGVDTVSDSSALDKLRKAIEEREKSTATYPVPEGRFPGAGDVAFEFSTQITTNELNRYQKAAKAKKRGNDVDAGKASALILAAKSVGIYINGKKLVDEDGDALTLRSEEIMSLTSSNNAADGVRGLLGDGTTTSMSDSLVGDAGYGDEYDSTGNPTSRD